MENILMDGYRLSPYTCKCCIVFKQFDKLNFDGLVRKHQNCQNFPPSNFMLYGSLNILKEKNFMDLWITLKILSCMTILYRRAPLFQGLQFHEWTKKDFEETISLQSAIHVTIGFPLIFRKTNFMEVHKIHEICIPQKMLSVLQFANLIAKMLKAMNPRICILTIKIFRLCSDEFCVTKYCTNIMLIYWWTITALKNFWGFCLALKIYSWTFWSFNNAS